MTETTPTNDQQNRPARDPTTDDVWQVHIDTDGEFRALAELRAKPSARENAAVNEYRTLALTEGGDDLTMDPDAPDAPFTFYGGGEYNAQCTVIPGDDRGRALGYFLHGVECHSDRLVTESGAVVDADPTEREVWGALSTQGVSLLPYHERCGALDDRDRRLLCMDLWEWRVTEGGDVAAEAYMADATWRTTNLSESAERLAEHIANTVPLEPRLCYRTAQQAAMKHAENHRVEYVEGIALPMHANQAIRHAWIEIDGDVAELTWPWHPFHGRPAVYIGTPVDAETVAETFERRRGGSPVLLDDETAERVDAAMRGQGGGA